MQLLTQRKDLSSKCHPSSGKNTSVRRDERERGSSELTLFEMYACKISLCLTGWFAGNHFTIRAPSAACRVRIFTSQNTETTLICATVTGGLGYSARHLILLRHINLTQFGEIYTQFEKKQQVSLEGFSLGNYFASLSSVKLNF